MSDKEAIDLSGIKTVSSKPFIRELGNILSAEITPDGNNDPVIIYESQGRRYLVEVRVWDVTETPFYAKKGLFERLAAARKKRGQT